jgi:hypothetical protein
VIKVEDALPVTPIQKNVSMDIHVLTQHVGSMNAMKRTTLPAKMASIITVTLASVNKETVTLTNVLRLNLQSWH